MKAVFDPLAPSYDREFTHSRIGLLQRQAVWDHLSPLMLASRGMEILELNCGTGADAIFMARHGHHVLATDISGEMLRVADERILQHGMEDRVTTQQLAFDDLHGRFEADQFDMVFSDFGGLNCIDENDLAALCDPIADSLRPKGRLVAVIMPDRCMAESGYFLLKGKWSEAFRRGRHEPLWASLSGSGVMTWYHSPKNVARIFNHRFRVVNVKPIGFFVPPSYLEPFFAQRPNTLRRLNALDELINDWRWTARYADHFLIDLERRP